MPKSHSRLSSGYLFHYYDPDFIKRVKESKGGFIVGGDNYGQGSSREHAAIAPRYLGIKAILALSFARIHRNNLINFGILPIEFNSKKEYNKIKQGDSLEIRNNIQKGEVEVFSNKKKVECSLRLKEREKNILSKGGLLNYIKK